MVSKPLPPEAYELAAKYDLGEPIRVYRTEKRPQFKMFGWIIGILYLFIIIFLIFHGLHFPLTHQDILFYGIFAAIMVFVALLFFVPLLLLPRTTVYVCSAGFILRRKANYQVVRWEDVEWVFLQGGANSVDLNRGEANIIYLTNQKQIALSKFIGDVALLAREIDLKARLVRRPEGCEALEIEFERLLNRQTARYQKKHDQLLSQKKAVEKETLDEALRLQKEYQLGEFVATYHGGFKGNLRKEAVGRPIYYLFWLAYLILICDPVVDQIFHFSLLPGEPGIAAFLLMPFLLFFQLFTLRFSARLLRLHLYAGGCIYMNGSSCRVVRWEEIEKIIYHKTIPLFLPPLCHIYLKNGDTLEISGYLHDKEKVKQIFDEHVANTVLAG